MASNGVKKTISEEPVDGQTVIVQRETTIQGFSPEEELKDLVNCGEWELIVEKSAYQERPPESQVQILNGAMSIRLQQLGGTFNILLNKGPSFQAAAMGVLNRMKQLRDMRDEMLRKIYEQFSRSLDSKAEGLKMEFYL